MSSSLQTALQATVGMSLSELLALRTLCDSLISQASQSTGGRSAAVSGKKRSPRNNRSESSVPTRQGSQGPVRKRSGAKRTVSKYAGNSVYLEYKRAEGALKQHLKEVNKERPAGLPSVRASDLPEDHPLRMVLREATANWISSKRSLRSEQAPTSHGPSQDVEMATVAHEVATSRSEGTSIPMSLTGGPKTTGESDTEEETPRMGNVSSVTQKIFGTKTFSDALASRPSADQLSKVKLTPLPEKMTPKKRKTREARGGN